MRFTVIARDTCPDSSGYRLLLLFVFLAEQDAIGPCRLRLGNKEFG